ncbi:MAG: recombinase family protein [Firmicutes bacterium]|nr:recombinase family protein [Bacillota bacterium]
MENKLLGYVRVSTREQKEDRQIIALTEYGVPRTAIFSDKISGKDFERRNYKRMLKKLKKGNILVVKSIDRLGRNYEEIIEQWRYITKDIGADIVILDIPILNTNSHKDLIGTLVSDIVLQLLSFVAQNERENIRQRQAEGIAAARLRGVHLGRKKQFYADNYIDIFKRYRCRYITFDEAKQLIGCCECTFYRMLSELRKSKKVP